MELCLNRSAKIAKTHSNFNPLGIWKTYLESAQEAGAGTSADLPDLRPFITGAAILKLRPSV